MRQSGPAGFLIGTNFDPTPNLRLEAQVRAVSETAFSISVGYLF